MSAALAVLGILGAIAVQGDSSCPSAREVGARLFALGVSSPEGASHRATLTSSAEGLTVRLEDLAGTVLGERTLASAANCPDLTEAAAVLIGTWEANLRTAEPAAPPEARHTAPPVAPGPPATTPELVAPDPQLPDVASEAQPLRHRGRPWSWELAAGASSSINSEGLAFGAQAFGSLTPAGQGWGVDILLGALGPRDIAKDGGIITWQRFPAGLGVHYRIFGDPVRIDIQAAALAALLTVQSQGFVPSRTGFQTADGGAAAGLRAEATWGPILVWFSLSAAFWPGKQVLSVSGDPVTLTLPRLEVLLAEGFAFGRG